MKTLTKLCAGSLLAVGMAFNAQAILITDPGVVGFYTGGYSPGTEENAIAQTLIDMPANTTSGAYQTGPTEYSGTLVAGNKDDSGGTSVPAGWDYVIAKYDGPNAGAVLFYIGGVATVLPQFPAPQWTTKDDQYALSHWQTYNRTPENTPDGGSMLVLLGGAVAMLGFLRRKISA